jgi:serine/threonine-protein kinase
VQDFVAGHTLAEELAEHRYGEAEVLAIVEELCEVLAYLHGRSPPVIHRDLKPRNVMRRTADGRLALIDFGAARDTVREQGGSLTTNHFS